MSLLNLGKKKIDATVKAPKKASAKLVVAGESKAVTDTASMGAHASSTSRVLIRPHITEKAAASAEKGVYVFEVAKNASKREIAQAIKTFYKVHPVKVTIVAIPPKKVIVKGRRGIRSGGKKAYVFLKKGEKIEVL